MKSEKLPFVVAIASVSGGGKTSAVEGLMQLLPNAKALHFDQYDLAGPEDMMAWLNDGADNNEWDLTPLLADLDGLLTQPLHYILLDFPFAYQHAKSSKYIDFAIFIDTPLDIALTRRLMRDSSAASAQQILEDVEFYARSGRAAYLHMLATIKPDSDVVIDGTASLSDVVLAIIEKLEIAQNDNY